MPDGLLHQAGNATLLAAGDQAIGSGQAFERRSGSCCLSTCSCRTPKVQCRHRGCAPWLPCSRHRGVHQVTDCMLPKVLIPNCCRLLMSCCSSRVGWPLHFAAPFYSLTTALAEPCASKVGKCPACCSSHTCLNPYRNVPCAAPQPAPYTFRVSRLLLCCAPAAGWFPHDSFSERCTTSRDKANIGCLQVGTSWVTAPPGKPRGVIHFEPGAFVGAAPQLTYQLLIQLLSGAGYTVGVLCCT